MSESSALTGQTIVITGAASGLGKAWAEGFLRKGAQVVGVDINAAGGFPGRPTPVSGGWTVPRCSRLK